MQPCRGLSLLAPLAAVVCGHAAIARLEAAKQAAASAGREMLRQQPPDTVCHLCGYPHQHGSGRACIHAAMAARNMLRQQPPYRVHHLWASPHQRVLVSSDSAEAEALAASLQNSVLCSTSLVAEHPIRAEQAQVSSACLGRG